MQPQPEPVAGGPARIAVVVTLGLALAGFAAAAVLPVYAGTTTESTTSGSVTGAVTTTTTDATATLAQVNGPGVLVVLAVPVLVAALPLLARRASAFRALRVTTAVLLPVLTLVGAMSVGVFFAPAALAAVVAAALPGRSAASSAPPPPTTQPA
ncbi:MULTISPECIES: hypothetical protein [unclassified Isoptericola]|uniref:hypothetical protein n=1 Tax=Isoptericola sp. NPDC057191 TaxID=3346041 RepID=UPI003627EA89